MFDAQKLLAKKFGWKQGQGLGKDNQGVNEPISVSSKYYKGYGLGANSFTGKSQDYEHWWNDLYTKSCTSLTFQQEGKESLKPVNDIPLETHFKELLSRSRRNVPSSDDDSDDEKFRLRHQRILSKEKTTQEKKKSTKKDKSEIRKKGGSKSSKRQSSDCNLLKREKKKKDKKHRKQGKKDAKRI